MTKYRLSNHSLMIEKGRHINLPKAMFFCPFFPGEVETEMHFLLVCPTYHALRYMFWQTIRSKPYFEYYTTEFKFIYLSDNLINNTSHYISTYFGIREFLTLNPKTTCLKFQLPALALQQLWFSFIFFHLILCNCMYLIFLSIFLFSVISKTISLTEKSNLQYIYQYIRMWHTSPYIFYLELSWKSLKAYYGVITF